MMYKLMLKYLPTDEERSKWEHEPNVVGDMQAMKTGYPVVTTKMVWQEYVKTPRDLIWPILKTIMKGALVIIYAVWVMAVVIALIALWRADDNVLGSAPGMIVVVLATLAIAYYYRKVSLWEPPYIILWEYIENELIAHRYNVNFDEIKHANFSQAQVTGWDQKFIVAYINGEASVYDEARSLSFEEALNFDFKGQWNTNMLFLEKYALETYMLNEPKQRLETNIAFYEKQLSDGHNIDVQNVPDTTKDLNGELDND